LGISSSRDMTSFSDKFAVINRSNSEIAEWRSLLVTLYSGSYNALALTLPSFSFLTKMLIDSLVCPLISFAFIKFTFGDRIAYDALYYDTA
jgi:hypothetical protein